MNLLNEVRKIFEPILQSLSPDAAKVPDYLGMVKPSANAEHGDYQANFAMPIAKLLGKKPPELAKQIIDELGTPAMVESFTVAGPGFINIKLATAYLAQQLQQIAPDDRLGIASTKTPRTIVIDYSGPNVAKPLHVGHLRSTIIGDALVRILRFMGHTVIGDNHLGDWGTQFGILIHGYKNFRDDAAFAAEPVRELARLYVHIRNLAKVIGDEDEAGGEVMDACRAETAKLHAGDAENVALWKMFMPHCIEMLQPIYQKLDVQIDHAHGESFYHDMLPDVVQDLLNKGIAQESKGAVVVPNAKGIIPQTDEEQSKEEPPALVRKRDGAFTYTTTDLATIRYRAETWKPDVLLYVVDARQSLHFKTLFANAKRWLNIVNEMHHITFGSILGKDGKPYGARKGGAPELGPLIDDAIALAREKYQVSYSERKQHGHEVPELSEGTKNNIAQVVGIGGLKYADLSSNRTSDYIFDPEKMLSTEGNTATYMQYAYARCRGILRKGNLPERPNHLADRTVLIPHVAEAALALQLLKFEEALAITERLYEPHHITAYLWDLSKKFNVFFENCKVVDDANPPEVQASRLLLVDLTGRTIQQALALLGIGVVERM